MSKKNEMTTANTAIVEQGNALPAFLNKNAAPRGAEHVKQEDLVIPRLELVQSLSPCRKKNDPAYIEGAEEGMMYNSVTRELYGLDVFLIPVAYRKEYLLWKSRETGGGFRGAFPSLESAEKAKSEMEDGGDIEIVDTAQHFCLLMNGEGSAEEIVVSMAKSKLKTSRKWNSLIRIAEVDSFAKCYKMSAVLQTNAKNQDFYGFDVSVGHFIQEPLYRRAEKLYNQIESGTVKVSTDNVEEASGDISKEF